MKEIETARIYWSSVRMASIDGLSELTSLLKKEDHPDLQDIANIIDEISSTIPEQINALLGELKVALDTGNREAVDQNSSLVLSELYSFDAFLKENWNDLRSCEENPFDLAISKLIRLSHR